MTVPPAVQPAAAKPPKDVYAGLAKESNKLFNHGRLLFRDVTIFLSKQYDLIKKHDKELFPVVLIAAAVTLLFANNLLATALSFSCGALFAIAKGDRWASTIINPILNTWGGSNIGKIALIAIFILIAAPLKWNLAAFGLAIYMVGLLRKAGGNGPGDRAAAAPPAFAGGQGAQPPVALQARHAASEMIPKRVQAAAVAVAQAAGAPVGLQMKAKLPGVPVALAPLVPPALGVADQPANAANPAVGPLVAMVQGLSPEAKAQLLAQLQRLS